MSNINRIEYIASRSMCIKKKTVLLVYDGIGAFHLSAPLMVFDQHSQQESPVDFVVCATTPGSVRTAASFVFNALRGLDALEEADAIIVPGWTDINEAVPLNLKDALRRANASGAQIVGMCMGVFVLAEAGLLNEKRATTHWQLSEVFEKRFPSVILDRELEYTRDGNLWSSAGGASAINMCLQLLQELQGTTVAEQVARLLGSSMRHQQNQPLVLERTGAYSGANKRLEQLLNWMREHLHETQHLDVLADRVHMSVRTFTRHFRQLTGMSVGQWRVNQQLQRAQLLLETSEATIESIAHQTGFGLALSLRKHFKKAFDTTPTAYRKQFRRINNAQKQP